MSKRVRVAITGAAGQIGYAILFRIASGQMFGPDVEVELSLLELPQALGALEGVVMELEDCAFPLLKNIRYTADLKEGMDGVNWAVLVGAVPRKDGMERADLLKINGSIFTDQGRAINDHGADDAQVLVVGNPCNTNCLIAMNNAHDMPNDRFFAMTALDEKRAKAQLAIKAGVDTTDVSNMIVWGNHSSTMYPDFYNAKIKGKPVVDVIGDEAWLQNEFMQTVQQRGAAIIKARGLSSAASAANAAVSTVYDLTHDSDEPFSVCLPSQGQYGVDEGLIFSYPVRRKNGKLEVIEGVEHPAYGKEKVAKTLAELQSEREAVKELI